MSSGLLLCLICDEVVETERQGNLMTDDGVLRARIEKVVGPGVDGTPRCHSLCTRCEDSLGTIEEYYRHVQQFRATFATTLAKYGENLLSMGEQSSVNVLETNTVQESNQEVVEQDFHQESDHNVGQSAGSVTGQAWTICLQGKDGSLMPLSQGAPLVMADDHQVVLETVTVESSETQQLVDPEEAVAGEENQEDTEQAEANTDSDVLHPSIVDHTGMALTSQTPENPEDEQSKPLSKPLFTCARCSVQFEQAEDLVMHERTQGHMGGYNYKCGVCGNIYARLDSLRDHMCRHTGEKPHQCNICLESFSFRNQLSRHRTSHYQSQGGITLASAAKKSDILETETSQNNKANGTEQSVNLNGEKYVTEAESQEDQNLKPVAISNEDLSTQMQQILKGSELLLVQTASGDVCIMTKENTKEEGYPCPKCTTVYSTRNLLERHQCPSMSVEYAQDFVCPKCNASFFKRSLLERHRCPSLFLEENVESQVETKSEPRETDSTEQNCLDSKNSREEPNVTDSNDIKVTSDEHASDSKTIEESQVLETDANELAEEEGIETAIKTLQEISEYSNDDLECTIFVCKKEKEDLLKALADEVKEESKLAGVEATKSSECVPSVFRRSVRAAGKVNPFLEMLKKKSRAKNNAQEKPVIDLDKEIELSKSKDPESPAMAKSDTVSISKENDKSEDTKVTESRDAPVVKRKRGRPPKVRPPDSTAMPTDRDSPEKPNTATPKRGRGRPPKRRGPGRPPKCGKEELSADTLGEDKQNPSDDINEKEVTPADLSNEGNASKVDSLKRKFDTLNDTDSKEERTADQAESELVKEPDEGLPEKRVKTRPQYLEVESGSEEEEISNKNSENTVRGVETKGASDSIEELVLHEFLENEAEIEKDIVELTEADDDLISKDEDIENSRVLRNKFGKIRRDFQKVPTAYKCEKCQRYFSTLLALKKHENTRIHKKGLNTSENRKFTCKVCGRGFVKIEHLRDHAVNHSGELQYDCVVCHKKFKFRSQLALHRNQSHSTAAIAEAMNQNPVPGRRTRYRNAHLPPGEDKSNPKFQPEIIESIDGNPKDRAYRCKNCLITFTELRLFNRHIISHFPVKPFKCDICAKEFARADTLRTHKKVHYCGYERTASGIFLCDTCGRQFTKADALRNHVKMHFGQRTWKCEVCGKGFVDKYTLSRHVVIHQVEKPWLCATCGRGFNRRSHLEAHEAQHTGKTLYKCEICDRGFSDQGNLGRHMLVHSDARPWKCSTCGDTFKRKGNLDEHELTHSMERQAVCDVCGARFTTKRYLRIHQLIHSGDRPHNCNVCSASFRQLSALITHRRIHTGDAPYKCTHCDKKFKYYDQWKAHEYSHSDAKPYKCMLCSATYRQAGSLRQHRKMVHGTQKGMLFLCTLCNKTFNSTMSLERHMKKVHGTEASLQNLQAISQEAMDSTGNSETPSFVQITNPQGAIETIELANLPNDNNSTENIVHLLNTGQVTMPGDGSVQLTDGQRIVHLVGSLDDNAQVLEVSGTDGQIIRINNTGNITNQDVVVSEGGSVLQYDPNTQQTVVQITDQQTFVDAMAHINQTDSHTTQSITEALTSATPNPAADSESQEVQTLTVHAEDGSLSVMTIPQELRHLTAEEQQIVSNRSFVPVEIVPVETTVTTVEEPDLVAMETEQAAESLQQFDTVDGGDIINSAESVVIQVDDSGVIHSADTDLITETVTHEMTGQNETVITTNYNQVANL